MTTITCPWCESDQALSMAAFLEMGEVFTCADCGTTVLMVDEEAESRALAA
jgi:uncharacterized Zn finger protein (UPF0148 family)